jgi:D-alanyl-lipoteichoic acid acyltransferase DltB (MBOAT superfamily)
MATRDFEQSFGDEDGRTLAQLIALMLVIAGSSYLPKEFRWLVSLPVAWMDVLIVMSFLAVISWGIYRCRSASRNVIGILVLSIIILFVCLKTPALSISLARIARQITGQSLQTASSLDFNWLGFSYVAFRLLHTLRDHRSGRLPSMGLQPFLLYVFFFPALSAGPIDKVERFLNNLSNQRDGIEWEQWRTGAKRIISGLIKKFVVADSFALIALNATHVDLVQSRVWLWLLLYAYSLRIYFDFSGYTDIAIGIGMLSGIHLPENFESPYLQTDLGAFWNRWHITLAQWFRSYVFNPLSRTLRQSAIARYPWLIILISQFTTMVLIGLWHGVTWNFAVWGAWHAMGLFIHNRWTDLQRKKNILGKGGGVIAQGRAIVSAFLTFNFVSLGWVWFSTPDIQIAWSTFLKLMGASLG